MTWNRTLATLTLSLALTAGFAPGVVNAEEPPPATAEGAESEGRPLDGYFLGAALGGLSIFILCKSARRS